MPFLASFAVLLTAKPSGQWWTLAFLIVVVAVDTGAYATGMSFGKHKMAPRISPKKTWEGFAGSAAAGLIAAVLLSVFMLQMPAWFGLVFGATMLFTATVGDLMESLIKRDLGIKDISTWLPGHGGFLDRMDSILPSSLGRLPLVPDLRVSALTGQPRLVRQNGPVSTTFPRTRRSRRGYNVEQVEEFLEEARRAYATPPGEPVAVSAESIRHTAFSLQRAGYSPNHVDAALERLEDAFATREREQALLTAGEEAWYAQATQIAQEIVDRLSRPPLHRFARAGVLTDGYDRKEVDAFTNRLLKYFEDRLVMTVDEVRTVAFRPRKHGYREAQVDLLLDSAIKVMQAVR